MAGAEPVRSAQPARPPARGRGSGGMVCAARGRDDRRRLETLRRDAQQDGRRAQAARAAHRAPQPQRSEEHTSELQSLMRNSYAVFCLTKKKKIPANAHTKQT